MTYYPSEREEWRLYADDLKGERDELLAALRVADAAINPPDIGGISLHEWNVRLKEATVVIRTAIARVEGQ